MNIPGRTSWTVVLPASVCLWAASLAAAPPQDAKTITLDKRYTDALNGFSLRPPAGMQRHREYSPSRLVSWTRRDAKIGAIDLTLMVVKRTESKKTLDLKPYSEALARMLADEEQFKVLSTSLLKVAGADAIDLRGVPMSQQGLWQRQVWIWSHPPQFLILTAAGPAGAREQIEAASRMVLDTFRIIDPEAAARANRESLEHGTALLGGLTDAKLKKIFTGQRSWHLLRMKDKDVGYMTVSTLQARSDGMDGYEARSLIRLRMPDDQPRVVYRRQFTTADRLFTRWDDSMTAGAGRQATSIVQKGIMQRDLVVCSLITNGSEEPKKKELLGAKAFFLPRALGMVLTQLVDLNKPLSYSFATYTPIGNGFDMRTLTVIGPGKITIAGREVDAIHLTDKAAADAEEAHLWVNPAGDLLQMKTAEGLIMEISTEAAILRRFPDNEMDIKSPR